MARFSRSFLIADALVVLLSGFTITCFPPGQSKGVDLGMPIVTQTPGTRQSVAACVLMLRSWCGWPNNLTVEFVHTAMGGTSGGVNDSAIPQGVRTFSCLSDATGHLHSEQQLYEELAKQIASVDAGWPFIARTRGMWHAVVVRGGHYFRDDAGRYKWNTVYINDPEFGYCVAVGAQHWTGGNFEVAFFTPGFPTL